MNGSFHPSACYSHAKDLILKVETRDLWTSGRTPLKYRGSGYFQLNPFFAVKYSFDLLSIFALFSFLPYDEKL